MQKCIGGGRLTSNDTWTPTFRKQQLARKEKSLLAATDASKKRNLMVVGGHADAVDLCGEDNTDAKRQLVIHEIRNNVSEFSEIFFLPVVK